jgi:excinuclease ABC subunit A
MNPLRIRGARTHNLRNLDLDLPKQALVVITGPSGSGKSSLAFDTLYAEGQRRYVESLATYARQFLPRYDKPDVDSIDGLAPAIAIAQRTSSGNPRSTVGTATEIHDYLRLLYARAGKAYCPTHPQHALEASSVATIVDAALAMPPDQLLFILAPLGLRDATTLAPLLHDMRSRGFIRFRINGQLIDIDDLVLPTLPGQTVQLDVIIDRLRPQATATSRLADSIEMALRVADGQVSLINRDTGTEAAYSLHPRCPLCGETAIALEPGLFSFNSPQGACPDCNGLGYHVDGSDPDKSLPESGARLPCASCAGTRLRPQARHVCLDVGAQRLPIFALTAWPLHQLGAFLQDLLNQAAPNPLSAPILKELGARVQFLLDVGLDYLSLDRGMDTVSGGEAQRIRLASQIGTGLSGVMYVLDEPSIGLHARDNHRLITSLKRLQALGNSVLVIEHDEETMRAADYLVDMGPGAGRLGGQVVAHGSLLQIMANPHSPTGAYLSGRHPMRLPPKPVGPRTAWLCLTGARGNNLQNVTLRLPVGHLVCITGVSGSGKSTLINDTLARAAAQSLNGAHQSAAPHDHLDGLQHFERVVQVDQAAIGRTPRSNPATYTGLMTGIRELFAATPAARERGYGPSRFSFNVAGGRCERCQGDGLVRVPMHFLPDVYVSCESCRGTRFNRETLEIRYKGLNIAEVLALSVAQARDFFAAVPGLERRLRVLSEVGLDYLCLGQSALTLSGGEAQRVKLALELSRRDSGRSLYILDEPTTGLHFGDIQQLLQVLARLRDAGNTLVVIEHNLDVIRLADWIVDLGPDAGALGGQVVAQGTPAQVAAEPRSHTGRYLK